MIKRLLILLVIVGSLLGTVLLFSYDIIKIDWISFMEIQPSYKPMDDPLPVAEGPIPVEGAAYILGMGAPANPIPVDETSLSNGGELYSLNCVQCHGPLGKGDGVIGAALVHPPADLTSARVIGLSDGAIFVTISAGVPGRMPNLNENLNVRERWDVVNYIRGVIQKQPQP
jgi:mono/diheme cytochrome c family protein